MVPVQASEILPVYLDRARGGAVQSTDKVQQGGFTHTVLADNGDTLTHFYDPLIAKVITHADTRDEAIDEMRDALGRS